MVREGDVDSLCFQVHGFVSLVVWMLEADTACSTICHSRQSEQLTYMQEVFPLLHQMAFCDMSSLLVYHVGDEGSYRALEINGVSLSMLRIGERKITE
mmetsp:Transcript_23566/g.43317  ORF Transcript_23566/g.43317 Transcript_23566/m.43317 type:complete len:98 (-) Transcript_23566:16-309(-)